jgi:anti-sigma factor RsiW
MSHVAEGSLQAFIDGELDGADRMALVEHLDVCASCAADLATLRRADESVHAALALLDTPVSMLRARAAIAARARTARRPRRLTRLGASSLARAAMLLLALAGAGAAAIPGSPVRRALEATIARVAGLFNGGEPVVVEAPATLPEAPSERESSSIAIAPADGRVRVQIEPPSGTVTVTVRLVDGPRARVETSTETGDVRFVSGMGRLEVLGLGTGDVVIEIPRSVSNATVHVGGLVHVMRQGEQLRLLGPAGEGQGMEVRFRIGG